MWSAYFGRMLCSLVARALRHGKVRRLGFTLVETVVAMGLCSVALSAFYMAVAQGLRILKGATEQAAASQLIEQRFETMRARPLWTDVITTTGVQAPLAPGVVSGLANVLETYTVGPYPGNTVAFTVVRQANGTVSATGNSLPLSQISVRITGVVSWGTPPLRRTRRVSTVFTKGGL